MSKHEKAKPNHERWMISYADLLTLLLALFIVLYAGSNQNKTKMSEMATGLKKAFDSEQTAITPGPLDGAGDLPDQASHAMDINRQVAINSAALDAVQARLRSLLAVQIADQKVYLLRQPMKLSIQLNADVLFNNGQADLLPSSVDLMTKVADSLTGLSPGFRISVEGYTDNTPISTAQYPSNWLLSAARAVSVVQLMVSQKVDSNLLVAEGYGENNPVADNNTVAGRAENRRVTIVIRAPDLTLPPAATN